MQRMSVLNKSRYKKSSLKVFTINGGISSYQDYRTPGNYPRMKTGSRNKAATTDSYKDVTHRP